MFDLLLFLFDRPLYKSWKGWLLVNLVVGLVIVGVVVAVKAVLNSSQRRNGGQAHP